MIDNKQLIWKNGNTEDLERKSRLLYNELDAADAAIAAQNRVILHDGHNFAYELSLRSLLHERQLIEQEIGIILQHRQNEFINFALDGPDYNQHRAPIAAIGHVLIELQKFYSRIADGTLLNTPRRLVSHEVNKITTLQLAGVYPSSFGMQLMVPTQTDLTGFSQPVQALEQLFWMFNEDNPSEKTLEMGPWVLMQYQKLLSQLLAYNAVPKVSWIHPRGEEVTWRPSRDNLVNLQLRLSRIKGQQKSFETVPGKLMGASLLSRRFELMNNEGIIRGKIDHSLIDQVARLLGKNCLVTYQKIVVIDEATERENRSYTLIDIQEQQ